jgi:hypothetical protein
MASQRRTLESLADAVAEGEAVDWASAAGRLRDDSARDLASALRVLALVGQRRDVPPARAAAVRPLGFTLFSALALLHVGGGLLALLWVPRDAGPIPPALLAANALAFAAAGVALPRLRPHDARVMALAGVFLAIAAACSHRPLRWLVEAGHGAWPLALLRGLLPDALLAFFLCRLVRRFPHVVRLSATDGLMLALERVAAVAGGVLFACNAAAYVLRPTQPWTVSAIGLLARPHPWGIYWLLQFGLAGVALAVIAWRSREAAADERRRTAAFALGLLVGLGPLVSLILLEFGSARARAFIEGPGLGLVGYAIYLPLLTVPFSTGYALTARRLPSARAALASAMSIALRRRALAAAALAPLPALALYVYVNRAKSTAAVLGSPLAAGLLALTLCAGLALFLRDRLAGRFLPQDRLHTLLGELTVALREAPTLAAAVDALAAHIRTGTGAASVIVLARAEDESRFNALQEGIAPLAFDSALALLVEESERVLQVDARDPQSSFRLLPAADRAWLMDNAVSALVAMRGASAQVAAVLALGGKADGLSWTGGDAAFVAAAAGAAALPLETRGLGRSAVSIRHLVTEGCAVECHDCGEVGEPGGAVCACGGRLGESVLPPLLEGKFRVERVLGRGGMGVVYRALDLELNRRVALKTLPGVTSRAALRLRAEARSMAAWVHPNLAVIFGAETWRAVPVLVVEYLEGGTLGDRLPGPLPAADVLEWGARLAEALEAMHAHGMLHRDVKPSNIGFTAAGTPKLLDFGLASVFAEEAALPPPAAAALLRYSDLAGTPPYMSAHVLAGGKAGPADDLWSLTVVLYEAIAGRRPRAGVPPAPRPHDAPMAGALREWFGAALAPRRDARFLTARAFRDELARLAAAGR